MNYDDTTSEMTTDAAGDDLFAGDDATADAGVDAGAKPTKKKAKKKKTVKIVPKCWCKSNDNDPPLPLFKT